MEGVPEKVLQRFVLEEYKIFQKYFDAKISYVRYNQPIDTYPDLYFVLEDKREIPVEVEWKTSNFLSHKHDSDILIQQKGFIFVGIIEPDVDVGSIKQFLIPLDKFEKWFEKNSQKLITETTKSLHEIDQKRELPKLWFTYLSAKGNSIKHFQTGLKHQVWGVTKTYKVRSESSIGDVKEEDLIAFIGIGKGFPGRIPLSDWIKKSFKGYFEHIYVFRVTSDYYPNESKIWETSPKGKWKDELYPHRFHFNNSPLLIMKNIKINQLGLTTKKELHSLVFSNFRKCESHTLVDIMHNGENLNLEELKSELEHISKITDKMKD